MSIYCSTFSIDANEHVEGCKRLVRLKRDQQAPRDKDGLARFIIIGEKDYAVDDSRPCTCGVGPIVYKHSGVLPSEEHERKGCLSLGAIPGHIEREGRPPLSDDFHPYWPYLRVSMFEAEDSIILTRQQVEKLRDALNEWLKLAERGHKP